MELIIFYSNALQLPCHSMGIKFPRRCVGISFPCHCVGIKFPQNGVGMKFPQTICRNCILFIILHPGDFHDYPIDYPDHPGNYSDHCLDSTDNPNYYFVNPCQGGIFLGSRGARFPQNLQAPKKCWQKCRCFCHKFDMKVFPAK